MITTSMTTSELLEEIKADYQNIFSISDTKDAKVSRIINKSGIFPLRIHSFVTTKRKKKWLILWEAHNKKDIGDNCRIAFLMRYCDGYLLCRVYCRVVSPQDGLKICYKTYFLTLSVIACTFVKLYKI